MKLSTQTDVLGRLYGDGEAIRMLAEAGFDAYDFSFFQMSEKGGCPMNAPDFRDYAKKLRDIADSAGIECSQAHAPFPSSTGSPAEDERRFQAIVRSMEAASILGARNIVVHPKQHLPYITCAEELAEINLDFYKSLVPYCERFGIHAACENMFQRGKITNRIIDSVCSRPKEFCEYIDAAGSPWIVACLDVGHAVLTDEDIAATVRTLGPRRLQALHVHDNNAVEDMHTLPYTGKIDFAALTSALKDIGYQGDFTLEADNWLNAFPKALVPDALTMLYKTGRYLAEQ